jgi:hypothetical protein
MKRFAAAALLAFVGIATTASAGPLPRPLSLADRAEVDQRSTHFVRGDRKLPRPRSFVDGRARPYHASHYVRSRTR